MSVSARPLPLHHVGCPGTSRVPSSPVQAEEKKAEGELTGKEYEILDSVKRNTVEPISQFFCLNETRRAGRQNVAWLQTPLTLFRVPTH